MTRKNICNCQTSASMSVPAVWHSQVNSHQAHSGPSSQILPVVGRCMLHAFESFKEPITQAVSWHSKRSVLSINEMALQCWGFGVDNKFWWVHLVTGGFVKLWSQAAAMHRTCLGLADAACCQQASAQFECKRCTFPVFLWDRPAPSTPDRLNKWTKSCTEVQKACRRTWCVSPSPQTPWSI